MPQRPDGKNPKTEKVTFTRSAADRIAKVVRAVEAGNRDCQALRFEKPRSGGGGQPIRICKFTGSWGTNTLKTVTFRNVTTTPNTATAMNLFANISVDCGERLAAIAREGTAWYLIAAQCS